MILQKIYHKLEEWIIMLDSPDFKDTDAGLVKEEMRQLAGKIWMNRDLETSDKDDKTNHNLVDQKEVKE